MDGWPRVLLQSGGLGSVGSPLILEGKYGGDKRNGHASLSKSGLVLVGEPTGTAETADALTNRMVEDIHSGALICPHLSFDIQLF